MHYDSIQSGNLVLHIPSGKYCTFFPDHDISDNLAGRAIFRLKKGFEPVMTADVAGILLKDFRRRKKYLDLVIIEFEKQNICVADLDHFENFRFVHEWQNLYFRHTNESLIFSPALENLTGNIYIL